TVPLVARLSVRTSVIVITIVTSTTSVAPKLRASSLRKVEWNNIGAANTWTQRRTTDYGLSTQDPGRRGRGTREVRCTRVRAGRGLQPRPRPAVAAGRRSREVRRPRHETGQAAAGVSARRRRRQARCPRQRWRRLG